jgi:hypothetical protein
MLDDDGRVAGRYFETPMCSGMVPSLFAAGAQILYRQWEELRSLMAADEYGCHHFFS